MSLSNEPFEEDTIVALSTPLGTSGIGVIRLSGPLCLTLAQNIFHKSSIEPRHSYFGTYRTLDGKTLDQCLYTYFAPKASFTGEAMLELSCHGNPLILKKVIVDCLARGCRSAEAGEFTRRAFTHGNLDLCQAEAVADLIHAQSEQALQLAKHQLEGSLSKKVDAWRKLLLEQIALIDAYIEFPEEDLPTENQVKLVQTWKRLLQEIEPLIQAHRYCSTLQNGLQVSIVGAPNAGKSTLLNTLLGVERALVSDIAGTTRDFIAENLQLGPYNLRLVDTAGIRNTVDLLEKVSIERTLEQLKRADLLILVLDRSQALPDFNKDIWALMDPQKTLVVLNKTDLTAKDDFSSLLNKYRHVELSLIEEPENAFGLLKEALEYFLENTYAELNQVPFLINDRQVQDLQESKNALQRALQLIQVSGLDDRVSAELKIALQAVDRLVGKSDYEQVLDAIFSKFCIGK